MDLELQGKCVLVAGASRGLGKAMTMTLLAEGAHVVAVARSAEGLDALAREASGSVAGSALPRGQLLTHRGDVTRADEVEALFTTSRPAPWNQPLAAAVANVGQSFARHASAMDEADFAASLQQNLWSSYFVARRAAMDMKAHGVAGSVVLLGSIYGREAGGAPGYNVAKAAVIALGKALARDFAEVGVRVNTVAPGSILFPGGNWDKRMQNDPVTTEAFMRREIPSGRFGTAAEVADVVAFLCSPRACWVNGATIVVDGGQSRAF